MRDSATKAAAKRAPLRGAERIEQRKRAVLAWLKRRGTKANRDGLARYGIVAKNAFGVSVGDARQHARTLGRDHALALALWDSGWHDARMLSVFVAEPEKMTLAEMERWCRSFQNWADCDAACFHVFDRTPHALTKVRQWTGRKPEFEKRAAFALLASLALHDKKLPDKTFTPFLALIRKAAVDERNFVKKGVLWALRGIGGRSPALYRAALKLAEELAASPEAASRWVGKNGLRELNSAASRKRLAKQSG
jgi:3-methyladenine DNA glycosylase AlkD